MERKSWKLLAAGAGCLLTAGMAAAQPGSSGAANTSGAHSTGRTGAAATPVTVTPVAPLSSLALVGVTQIGNNSEAWLVDLNTHQRVNVTPGQGVFGFQVVSVGTEQIVLSRNGHRFTLSLGQNQLPNAVVPTRAPAMASSAAAQANVRRAWAMAARNQAITGLPSPYAPYGNAYPYGYVPGMFSGQAMPYGAAIGPTDPYGNPLNQMFPGEFSGQAMPNGSAFGPASPYGNAYDLVQPGTFPYANGFPGNDGNAAFGQSFNTPYPALTPGSGVTPYGNVIPYPYGGAANVGNTPTAVAPNGAPTVVTPNATAPAGNPQTLRRAGSGGTGATGAGTPALATPQTQRRRASFGQ